MQINMQSDLEAGGLQKIQMTLCLTEIITTLVFWVEQKDDPAWHVGFQWAPVLFISFLLYLFFILLLFIYII